MRLAKLNDKLILLAPYDQRDLVKAIGNYRWNKSLGVWEFPFRKVILIIESFNVEVTGEVKQIYQEYKEKEEECKKKLSYIQSLYSKNWNGIHEGLFRHQKITLEAARQFDSYALFLKPGLGKTLVIQELFLIKKAVRALVVCPLNVISVWEEEIQKWHPELSFCNLWKNIDLLESKNANIYLINYEQFKKFYAIEPDVIRRKITSLKTLQRKSPHKFMEFEEKIELLKQIETKELKNRIDFLVIDESSKLKDNGSQITETALFYKDKIPYRFIMSGTPNPNSELEFWGQMCFINSDLLGDNFYRFRNKYFTSFGYGNYQFTISKENREKIMSKIKEQAIFFSKEDNLDLPEQIFEKRYIEMESKQRKVYQEMFNENIAYFEDKVSISSTELVKLMKLREITSGFFFDDKGEAVTISLKKLDALMEVLEEIGNCQVTIFCNFDWEIATIKEQLGDKAVVLSGLIKKQKDKDENKKLFKNNIVQYLIANIKSSSHGHNFQNCHYVIYFSLSYSNEDHEQSQDRFHRPGQKNNVTYFYLLMKQSIDEILYKVLVRKANLSDSCMEMLKG